MTSQAGSQTIAIDILPKILRSKDNQAMKFGQLIECNGRNIFVQKLYRKWDREPRPGPFLIFLKNLKWCKNKSPAA